MSELNEIQKVDYRLSTFSDVRNELLRKTKYPFNKPKSILKKTGKVLDIPIPEELLKMEDQISDFIASIENNRVYTKNEAYSSDIPNLGFTCVSNLPRNDSVIVRVKFEAPILAITGNKLQGTLVNDIRIIATGPRVIGLPLGSKVQLSAPLTEYYGREQMVAQNKSEIVGSREIGIDGNIKDRVLLNNLITSLDKDDGKQLNEEFVQKAYRIEIISYLLLTDRDIAVIVMDDDKERLSN